MQITGSIQLLSTRSGEKKDGSGTWSSQTVRIVETSGQYPKSLVADIFNDKVAFVEGEVATWHFQTEAREYNGRYFNDVKLWKKEPVGGTQAQAAPARPAKSPLDDDDDLPL